MTNTIHDTAVKVGVYPNEFIPIMKAMRFALSSNDFKEYVLDGNKETLELLEFFLDDFKTIALNEAV
jgi:hypothetical protein